MTRTVLACAFLMVSILQARRAKNTGQVTVDETRFRFLLFLPSNQAMVEITKKASVALFLLLAVCLGTALAQNSACTKQCLDKNAGPCSGLNGKAYATCVGACKQSCQPPPPPPPLKAMDVAYSADLLDSNGLARNPLWQRQKQTGYPPDPNEFCPTGSNDPSEWRSKADCTSDNNLHFNSSDFCSGHMNWYPVEYEGTITWGDHSTGIFDDDDYFFYVDRPDHALKTAASGDTRQGTEIEFDAGETVDYWDNTNTWWDSFHHDYVDQSSQAAHDRVDGDEVILIGMVGLDTQHSVHSELHPIYAMFVHFQSDATQDRWAFFVRNWGNEGGCGSDQEPLPTGFLSNNTLRVLIPHAGGQKASLTDNAWVYGDDENERNQQGWSYQPTNGGVLLSFSLRDPSKQVGFVGDLTINWGLTTGVTRIPVKKVTKPVARVGAPKVEPYDDDQGLKVKFQTLKPADQEILLQEVRGLTHHLPAEKKAVTLSTAPASKPLKPTGPYPTYGSMFKAMPDPVGQARKTKQREHILEFLKAHGNE
jgi:hypothetical protein